MMKDLRAGMRVRLLEADIKILESQNNQQIKEMELIHWYIVVMEQGIDASKAMKNYAQLKEKCETLQK